MTSVVRFVASLGRYCIRLTQDGVDQLVAPRPGSRMSKTAGTASGSSPLLAAF